MKNSEDVDIYLFSPFCLLRPTTNRIFDMRLCDAFAGEHVDVTIIYPFTYMKENILKSEIPKSYGVRNVVKTRILLTPLREHSSRLWFMLVLVTGFSFSAFRIFVSKIFSRKETVIFSRDAKLLLSALLLKNIFGKLLKVKVIYICSEVKNSMLFRFVIRNADGIMAGVTATKNAIQEIVPVPPEKFILALAPIPAYDNDCPKEEARRIIKYDNPKPLVVYTGKISPGLNELIYILAAAADLPEYQFLATGGKQSNVEHYRRYCEERNIGNVAFTGFFNDSTYVRYYQLAADVLVSYYNDKDHFVEYNYPQKLNEYLSTRNPIVTPDFPATQDIINETNVYFVDPDNPKALAAGIKKLIEDKELARKISDQAFLDSKKITFKGKVQEILRFTGSLK
ncbi:MAG: glycosyltransferase family 4 protein [Bacteroidota bacterium]